VSFCERNELVQMIHEDEVRTFSGSQNTPQRPVPLPAWRQGKSPDHNLAGRNASEFTSLSGSQGRRSPRRRPNPNPGPGRTN
jgi:hypothetical protein